MIRSKSDYLQYIEADIEANGAQHWRWWMHLSHPTLGFLIRLRRIEYVLNCYRNRVYIIYVAWLKITFRIHSIILGFTIPPNTCGAGLTLNHWGTIVISPLAKIGRNARINVCVNIGLKDGKAPIIGDNVYFGPGAKLFGAITIGDNVKIGANAVVNRSFPSGVILAGVPAKIIKQACD